MAGKHDHAQRRQAARKGRERGCSLYIPAEQLQRAGIDPNGPPPFYRTWEGPRRSIMVTLYTEA